MFIYKGVIFTIASDILYGWVRCHSIQKLPRQLNTGITASQALACVIGMKQYLSYSSQRIKLTAHDCTFHIGNFQFLINNYFTADRVVDNSLPAS